MLKKLLERKTRLAVIGLGYVGMPLAIAFSKKLEVIGFDLNTEKINHYRRGVDPTKEVGDDAVKKAPMLFTSDEKDLEGGACHAG